MALQTPQFSISEKTPEPEAEPPERKKGYFQIIKETLLELRQPSAWLRYTKEIIASIVSQGAGKGKTQLEQAAEQAKKSGGKKTKFWQALQKPSFWINVALLIILAIVLAWIYL